MQHYDLAQLLPANIFAIFLVMTRVGAALAWLPGYGANYVPMRVKAVLAVLIAVVATPVLANQLPAMPKELPELTGLIAVEAFVGAFIGLYVSVLMSALDFAGGAIALQTSLSSAIVFNPGEAKQETLPAGLLSAAAVVLIFATDLDHLFLRLIVDSYHVFPAGAPLPMGDLADALARTVAESFALGIEIAAPFLILGTVFYAAIGLVGRMMPQLQIFYVALPLQIFGGLAMLMVAIPTSLLWFLGHLDSGLTSGVWRH